VTPKAPASRWIAAALAAGVGLRLWQYLGNPSLWIDELALARNILERPVSGLVGAPLDFAQVAPPGFLLLVKAAAALFGNGEHALRLVPILGALVSLPLFLALARRVLPARAVPVAMVLFALAPPLFRLGSDLKQYSTDVAIATAMALLALRWLDRPDVRRGLILGGSAALAVWISQTVVFAAGGAVLALAVSSMDAHRRATLKSLVPGAAVALTGMLGSVLVARATLTPAVQAFMHSYWDRWFIPWRFRPALRWLFDELPDPFRGEYGLAPVLALAYTLLIAVGCVRLWRRDRAVALIIIMPVLATLAAAAAHQYPFARRLVAFLLPSALLGIGAAIDLLGEVAGRWRPRARMIVVGVLMVPSLAVVVTRRPVIRLEESRPAWAHIASRRSADEPVYVYFTGWLAAGYYAPRAGIPDRDVRYGRCHATDLAGYRAELQAFAGHGALTLFFTHALTRDRVAIVAYLDSAATRLDSLVIPQHPPFHEPSASVYRYDMSAMRPGPDSVPQPGRAAVCSAPGPHLPVDSALAGWGRR